MPTDNTPLTRGEFTSFVDLLTDHLTESNKGLDGIFKKVVEALDSIDVDVTNMRKDLKHIHRRLDDIERKVGLVDDRTKQIASDVDDVKSDVHEVRNATRVISELRELAWLEGEEFGKLQDRVRGLESQPKKAAKDGQTA